MQRNGEIYGTGTKRKEKGGGPRGGVTIIRYPATLDMQMGASTIQHARTPTRVSTCHA